ncbi:MAG TPA: VOC family protein [Actinocatenispora sp.]
MPCWTQLCCPDPAGAADFYGRLFGWSLRDDTFWRDGLAVAGVAAGPPRWLPYVSSEDVAVTAAAVTAAGGTAGGQEVDPRGRGVVCADPAGAAFGVWQHGSIPGAQLVNEPGTVLWIDLVTSDLAAADDFYGGVFRWQRREVDYGDGIEYYEWMSARRPVAGARLSVVMGPAVPSHWSTTMLVADCADAARRAETLGGSALLAPTPAPVGTYALLADPSGATFGLLELTPEILAGIA